MVKTKLAGAYNLENIMAAVAVGKYFGLSNEQVSRGLASYTPTNNRSQILLTDKNNHVICDYYNANASSMNAALENFDLIAADHKVLILGDMFELGDSSSEEHASLLEKAQNLDIARALFVGKHFFGERKQEPISASSRFSFFESLEEALVALEKDPIRNAWILLKGSRGMTLENLLKAL